MTRLRQNSTVVGKAMQSEFIKLQQNITDQELQEMPAGDINEILSTMKAEEAFDFLERIGRLRARLVYASLTHLPEHKGARVT